MEHQFKVLKCGYSFLAITYPLSGIITYKYFALQQEVKKNVKQENAKRKILYLRNFHSNN